MRAVGRDDGRLDGLRQRRADSEPALTTCCEPIRTLTATIAGRDGRGRPGQLRPRTHVLFAMALLPAGLLLPGQRGQRMVRATRPPQAGGRRMSRQGRRKAVDRSFTGISVLILVLLAAALLVILLPICAAARGPSSSGARWSSARSQLEMFGVGDRAAIEKEIRQADAARKPVYDMLAAFDQKMHEGDFMLGLDYVQEGSTHLKELACALLGPPPGDGRARWCRGTRYGADALGPRPGGAARPALRRPSTTIRPRADGHQELRPACRRLRRHVPGAALPLRARRTRDRCCARA